MDLKRIQELEAMEKAATAGKWRMTYDPNSRSNACLVTEDHDLDAGGEDHAVVCTCFGFGRVAVGQLCGQSDADFIAALRNAAQELLRLAKRGLELQDKFRHTFKERFDDPFDPYREKCAKCGLNIRDEIHSAAARGGE